MRRSLIFTSSSIHASLILLSIPLFVTAIDISQTSQAGHIPLTTRLSSSTNATHSATSLSQNISSTSVSSSTESSVVSLSTTVSSTFSTASTTSGVISSTSPPQPTQTLSPVTSGDIEIIHGRRISSIIGALTNADSISAWLSSLGSDGKWPDNEIDYTTGCEARRANWPAQVHWQRLVVMTGAWHGGLEGADQYVKNEEIRTAISLAMDYWFSRDFSNDACLDLGGTPSCPCDNPDNSLWNTNWFSNVILTPDLVGQTCLLLNDTLTPTQLLNCTHMTGRSYGAFDRNINGLGFITGANTLDVASIGIDQALLTVNVSLLTDAYRRIHLELTIANSVKADGIRQHSGILYNGNYGKDYTNDILGIEIDAGGTQFAANSTSQTAFARLFDGDRWMIYRNAVTGVNHWDFSVLGRFISFPVIDKQATGSININLTQVKELGEQWSSETLIKFADSLSKSTSNANAGRLSGNRMFYTNDYMVHRGSNYVSTLKMFSSRTQNTECVNTQNPLGFHLSDGTFYTYLRGDEYEDISVAWDWNLIPGITVDYGATPLNCNNTQFTGIEKFVGGASDGQIGLAVMRYTNPFTGSLRWQKAWFFLEDDVQHVMIANISSATAAPVYSVLDQRRHSGTILVDGIKQRSSNHSRPRSLWHGDVGYLFSNMSDDITLSLQVGEKTGNWTAIGISTQPPTTFDIFAAWIEHKTLNKSVSYTVFPSTTASAFIKKSNKLRLQSIQNDGHISAIFDEIQKTAMAVFWDETGGSITIAPSARDASITISTTNNALIIYKLHSGELIVSDPSQTLSTVQVTLALGNGSKPPHWGKGRTKTFVLSLPQGGVAGSSLIQKIY